MDASSTSIASFLAHGGTSPDDRTGAVVPAVPLATTFARDADSAPTSAEHVYVRDHDDAVRRVEAVIRHLEGAAATRVFASGMAAIAAVIRSLRPGDTLVLQSRIYWANTAFTRRITQHAGIRLVEVDLTDLATARDAIAEHRPALVVAEAVSNPWMRVLDTAAIATAVHDVGGRLAVDATVPTPLAHRPLAHGADVSIHSATKSLNGHSDVLAGVVSTGDADTDLWRFVTDERAQAGAVLGPFGASMLLRGLRTLALRHERSCANAAALADRLRDHAGVDDVWYPGLADHPDAAIVASTYDGHPGSLLSVLVRGGATEALAVAGRLELVLRATSLGGVESLVEHRHTIEGDVTDVPPNLLRCSVGIEDLDDLVVDWTRALDA